MTGAELMRYTLEGRRVAGPWSPVGSMGLMWQRKPANVPVRMLVLVEPHTASVWAEEWAVEFGGITPTPGWWRLAVTPPDPGYPGGRWLLAAIQHHPDGVMFRARLAEAAEPVASLAEGQQREDERLRSLGVELVEAAHG